LSIYDNSQQDNTNVTVLPPELFCEILILDNDIEKRIAQATDYEKQIQDMIPTGDDWEQLANGIILFKGCAYVPPSLWETVLSQHHDSLTSGHPGIK